MPGRINIVGEKYGELTVIEMLYGYNNGKHTYCRCVNDVGDEVVVRLDALRSGATKTAKGAQTKGVKKNLIGSRFGRLTVQCEAKGRAANGSVLYYCDCDCGNHRIVSSGDLTRGRTQSCGCLVQEHYDAQARDLTGMRFGGLTVVKYVGKRGLSGSSRRMWQCLCDCGNYCEVSLSDLVTGNTQTCGCQQMSHGERIIFDLLTQYEIPFVPQKTFDDCRYRRKLPFDFYLETYNTVIEYDGEQHFRSVDFFGGEEEFEVRKQRDTIKSNYCEEHNIRLIRIPYYYTKNEVEAIVLDILSPATITA